MKDLRALKGINDLLKLKGYLKLFYRVKDGARELLNNEFYFA